MYKPVPDSIPLSLSLSLSLSLLPPTLPSSHQQIITDEAVKRPEQEDVSMDDISLCQQKLEGIVASGDTPAR